MTDREKVIKGLEKLRQDLGYGLPDRSNVVMECLNSLTDAIDLLKEQEPERVEIVDSDGGRVHWYVCATCKALINPGDRFCHECGRKAKWDE